MFINSSSFLRSSFRFPADNKLSRELLLFKQSFVDSHHNQIKTLSFQGFKHKFAKKGSNETYQIRSFSTINGKSSFAFKFDDQDAKLQPYFSKNDLSHFVGYDKILPNVINTIYYLQNPKEFIKRKAKLPDRILIKGPNGVGKTLLAEAIAGHAGVPILALDGKELSKLPAAKSEALLHAIFKKARAMAPCMIFIKEINLIASSTINEKFLHLNSLVNQLLILLSQDHPEVVIVATSDSKKIDSEIYQPEQFDNQITLSLPDRAQRENILKIYTQKKKLTDQICFRDLSFISKDFSGAHLVEWVKLAATYAKLERCLEINHYHFDIARTLLKIGSPHQNNDTQEQVFRNATHEIGRALVGHLLNFRLYKVSIQKYGLSTGRVEWIPLHENHYLTWKELIDQICVLCAGRAAEIVTGFLQTGSKEELNQAKILAEKMINDEGMGSTVYGNFNDVEDIIQSQMERACHLIINNKAKFDKLREALIKHSEILREDFLNILEEKPMKYKMDLFKNNAQLRLPPKATRRIL